MLASTVSAQSVRTFVASTGSDANPCSRTAPCRTLQAAFNAAASGGEVVALDSAGFGSNLSINKSISIIGPPGIYAGITVFSGDGIDINAGAGDTVTLRGLTIVNQSSGVNGIVFTTGAALYIESCIVNGFNPGGSGVAFQGPGNLVVHDSAFRNNGDGIALGGSTTATLDQVRLEANTNGLDAKDGVRVNVRNSVVSENIEGLFAASSTAAPVEMNVENCLVSYSVDTGIIAGQNSTGTTTVRVSNSTIINNGNFGLHNFAPATLLSRGNNTIEGNGTNTVGTISSYMAK